MPPTSDIVDPARRTRFELPDHLDQTELAQRWRISPRTLERWRWNGQGPAYLRLGGRAIYRLVDVESYEKRHLRSNSPDSPNDHTAE